MQAEDQILPFVLQALSQKPTYSDTFGNLCKDLESNCSLRDKYQKTAIPELIESAVKVGQDLGIVTLNHDLVRMPFKFFSKSTHTLAPNLRKDEKKAEDKEDNAAVKETDNYNLKKCDSKKPSVFNPVRTKVKPRMPRIRKVCNHNRQRSRKLSSSKRGRRTSSRSSTRRSSKSHSRSRKCRR